MMRVQNKQQLFFSLKFHGEVISVARWFSFSLFLSILCVALSNFSSSWIMDKDWFGSNNGQPVAISCTCVTTHHITCLKKKFLVIKGVLNKSPHKSHKITDLFRWIAEHGEEWNVATIWYCTAVLIFKKEFQRIYISDETGVTYLMSFMRGFLIESLEITGNLRDA